MLPLRIDLKDHGRFDAEQALGVLDDDGRSVVYKPGFHKTGKVGFRPIILIRRVGDYKGVPMLFAERYGFALALACSAPWLARSVGFDRDRAYYPTVLIVIASYYVLFAVMGGSMRAVILESIVMSAFLIVHVGYALKYW